MGKFFGKIHTINFLRVVIGQRFDLFSPCLHFKTSVIYHPKLTGILVGNDAEFNHTQELVHEFCGVEPLQFAILGIELHPSVFCPFDTKGSASSLRAEVFGKNKVGRKIILFHCIVFGCAGDRTQREINI